MQVIFRISDGILKDQLSQLLLQIPGITVPDRITHADYCLVDMDDEQNKDLSSCPADRLVGFSAHKDGTDESGRFKVSPRSPEGKAAIRGSLLAIFTVIGIFLGGAGTLPQLGSGPPGPDEK